MMPERSQLLGYGAIEGPRRAAVVLTTALRGATLGEPAGLTPVPPVTDNPQVMRARVTVRAPAWTSRPTARKGRDDEVDKSGTAARAC